MRISSWWTLRSGKPRTLTHDRRAVSFPRWSPAGDRLAFLATGANAKPQIFVMPMTGGDAVQITKIGHRRPAIRVASGREDDRVCGRR